MFFPIRTDRRNEHTPWVNITLIVVNALIFLYTRERLDDPKVYRFLLNPDYAQIYQFITYQFLHDGPMHVISNMLFLWIFGNAIEDRFGKIGYLFFYLAGGVIAGAGHCMMSHTPVLGASGAVAAITGAFLALFPRTYVTIAYWFFFIGTFEVAAMWLILLQIAQDLFFQIAGGGRTAYLAHLAGYAFGFFVGMSLLWVRLLPREPFDLLAMFEQHRRRQKFRELTKQGYHPWEHVKAGDPPRAGSAKAAPADPRLSQIMDLRAKIQQELSGHDLPRAAESYAQLLEIDPSQTMSRQAQLDLASQLYASEQYEVAAQAYELFLSTYRGDAQREEVELLLALVYARYLARHQRAKELLASALPRMHDSGQKAMAQQLLTEIG
jgi:membrane associated rhomboid family serine protease